MIAPLIDMLTKDQITELARAQAQYLSFALSHAQKSLELMPTIRREDDARLLVRCLHGQFLASERTYEAHFGKIGGFIDARLGQTPVDLMNEWVATSAPRDAIFYTLCQWVIAQRLRTQLLIEMAASPLPLVALARFCVSLREEAQRCVQQSKGEGAAMLAEHVQTFSELIDTYQDRLSAANAKKC